MTRPAPKPVDTPADPIRKTVTVPLDPDTAFDLFTRDIDRWWPMETHSLAAQEGNGGKAQVRVEPREGGQVIETGPDGREAPWADVTVWEPGRRLGLRWYVGRSPDEATEVDVRFTGTEAGTRVDLTHGGFAALGERGPEVCAGYTSGWDHVLGACYGARCARAAA